MRVIGEDNAPLGILSKREALELSQKEGLDLVIVTKNAQPPIAKIVDWGKYNYDKKKKQQQIKRTQLQKKKTGLKGMKFGIKIGDYDLNIKLRKVKGFLEEGCKVRITIILRGREMEHKDQAFDLAQKIIGLLGDVVVEQQPRIAGYRINFTVRGGKNA